MKCAVLYICFFASSSAHTWSCADVSELQHCCDKGLFEDCNWFKSLTCEAGVQQLTESKTDIESYMGQNQCIAERRKLYEVSIEEDMASRASQRHRQQAMMDDEFERTLVGKGKTASRLEICGCGCPYCQKNDECAPLGEATFAQEMRFNADTQTTYLVDTGPIDPRSVPETFPSLLVASTYIGGTPGYKPTASFGWPTRNCCDWINDAAFGEKKNLQHTGHGSCREDYNCSSGGTEKEICKTAMSKEEDDFCHRDGLTRDRLVSNGGGQSGVLNYELVRTPDLAFQNPFASCAYCAHPDYPITGYGKAYCGAVGTIGTCTAGREKLNVEPSSPALSKIKRRAISIRAIHRTNEGYCKLTVSPTKAPTALGQTYAPTKAPTKAPTPPTLAPTKAPTKLPTKAPTKAPTPPTLAPTKAPTKAPTRPTPAPTTAPTPAPTPAPTTTPTPAPTPAPTTAPTPAPTTAPTPAPTPAPTTAPTPAPTTAPTPSPTDGGVLKMAVTIASVKCTASPQDITETEAKCESAIAASLSISEKQVSATGGCHGKRRLLADSDDLKMSVEIHAMSPVLVDQLSQIINNKAAYEKKLIVELVQAGLEANVDSVTYAPGSATASYPTNLPTPAPSSAPTATPTSAPTSAPTLAPTPIIKHPDFHIAAGVIPVLILLGGYCYCSIISKMLLRHAANVVPSCTDSKATPAINISFQLPAVQLPEGPTNTNIVTPVAEYEM